MAKATKEDYLTIMRQLLGEKLTEEEIKEKAEKAYLDSLSYLALCAEEQSEKESSSFDNGQIRNL